ncbi:hypothetical protein PM082_003568 [Marasmius tenuissimus]|nr:hypothetical protein PM082_003568 [Marasmius tenuissimus]
MGNAQSQKNRSSKASGRESKKSRRGSHTPSNEKHKLGPDSDSGVPQHTDSHLPSYAPTNITALKPCYDSTTVNFSSRETASAYDQFLREYPEYQLTRSLDVLRRTDYRRLERTGETYVDYMGGSLYPESLVRAHTKFLCSTVLGNTHSVSNSSTASLKSTDEARVAVLSFFKAPPGYTVIFTPNATGALKLVGEAFPFANDSTYILGTDAHNSLHGIRQFAAKRGASVLYIPSTPQGGFELKVAQELLEQHRPSRGRRGSTSSLFAITGQSNITNTKNPLSTIKYAATLGYSTLLDAAALAPTSSISLEDIPVDAMAVSFYKMFGYPTGVGGLVIKKSFLEQLQRPWFAGGNVDVVQVPGEFVTMSKVHHECFEDGTINYLMLSAVTEGLRFLSACLPLLPLRLSCLTGYLATSLSQLKHESTGKPVVRILSRIPQKRLRALGQQSDTGSTVSLIFLSPSGEIISNSFVEHSASKANISLRTGCMCNPGGAAAILGLSKDLSQFKFEPGVSRKDVEETVGREIGVVRISLGLGSNFQDVWNVIQFASLMAKNASPRDQ